MQQWTRPLRAYKLYYEKYGQGDECWEWLGSINSQGYGQLCNILAHRLAVVEWGDCEGAQLQLSEALDVHHRCRTKSCFRPSHLKILTKEEHGALHGKGF